MTIEKEIRVRLARSIARRQGNPVLANPGHIARVYGEMCENFTHGSNGDSWLLRRPGATQPNVTFDAGADVGDFDPNHAAVGESRQDQRNLLAK